MAIFSFLHRLVCKKCKTKIGSHRTKRREERLQRLGKTQTQDEWQPSWVRETTGDVEDFNEHDSDEDDDSSSVVKLGASSSSSDVSISTSSSVSSLAPFSPTFPDFSESVAPSSPIAPPRPPAFGISITTTTTLTTAVTTNRYSSSPLSPSSTLSTSSSRNSLTRVPGVRNLRRLSDISHHTAPYPPSPPPRLMFTWEQVPPSPLIVGSQFCNSPSIIPAAFVDVKKLPCRSVAQRFPLLLLDASDDDDSYSGESTPPSPSSSSSSPASSTSTLSTASSTSSTSSISLVSPLSPVTPTAPAFDKPLPALPIVLSVPSSPRASVNLQRNSKVSPLAGRCISAGDGNSIGPRYVPSSKTVPRPRHAPQRPTPQQTLPFLRTSTTFDEILASKTSSSSSSNSTPLTFDEILGSPARPAPKLIHRKPIAVFSPKIQKPAAPTTPTTTATTTKPAIVRNPSQTIRPYDRTRPSRHAQQVVSLSLLSSANSPPPQVIRLIPYNSRQGYSILQTLRRLLLVPVDWPAAQTLLFILQHPAVRHLALPFHLSSSPHSDYFQDLLGVPRSNMLGWYGILQAIDGPMRYHAARKRSQNRLNNPNNLRVVPPTLAPFSSAERDLVARWLASGEPIFTGQTRLSAVLLRKSGKPMAGAAGRTAQQVRGRTPLSPMASSSVRTNDDRAASSLPPIDPATRYDISRNPRCRYHQLWTGAGKSRLSLTMLAEVDV